MPRELFRNCLRLRPDRIILGDVRGGEVLDLLQAMNTGHDGSMSTIHANDTRDVLDRIELLGCAIRRRASAAGRPDTSLRPYRF